MDEYHALGRLVISKIEYGKDGRYWWPSDILKLDQGLEMVVRRGVAERKVENSSVGTYTTYSITKEGKEEFVRLVSERLEQDKQVE